MQKVYLASILRETKLLNSEKEKVGIELIKINKNYD